MRIQMATRDDPISKDVHTGSVTAGGQSNKTSKSKASSNIANQTKEIKQSMQVLEN